MGRQKWGRWVGILTGWWQTVETRLLPSRIQWGSAPPGCIHGNQGRAAAGPVSESGSRAPPGGPSDGVPCEGSSGVSQRGRAEGLPLNTKSSVSLSQQVPCP